MKYDFFKDFNHKHALDIYHLYSELFKGVRFIPNTYYVVNESTDKNGQVNGYICVNIKDPNDNKNIIKFYIGVFKQYPTSYHVHNIYFIYNNEYFVISNIHFENDGLSYKCECFDDIKLKNVCESKNTNLPKPEDFAELKVEANIENNENIPHYFRGNIISYITEKYYFEKDIKTVRELLEDKNEPRRVRA
ncbi:MAG: hypothetical protein IKX00_02315 [Bacilli bacterium]|nr:hypothetical protein [Bacilli bacterium]